MSTSRTREVEAELVRIFRTSATKHEANVRAKPILEQSSRDPAFLSEVLQKYVETPGALDKGNYPVVGIEIALNPYFGLVANCWIPLPDRRTDVSTKCIHHHGDLLLSTATIFGPGYEHWMFSTPKPVREGSDVYAMDLLEAAPHPKHHVSFVDAWIAHTPLYPADLSITLALWTSRHPVTWRDHAKRLRIFRGREEKLRRLAVKLRLRQALQVKVVESFDYHPSEQGFVVMRDRKEFGLGPNEDHVCSVLHVVQRTGNEHLARNVRRAIDRGAVRTARPTLERLLRDLEKGTPIEGRLSPGHYDVPYANFTRDEIRSALKAVKGGLDGSKLASAAGREAHPGARPD